MRGIQDHVQAVQAVRQGGEQVRFRTGNRPGFGSTLFASLGSGLVVAFASFATLGLLGAAFVIVPFMVILARRGAVAAG